MGVSRSSFGPLVGKDFFTGAPVACARDLVGGILAVGDCAGMIVETEAYEADNDPACHTFFRQKARKYVEEHDAGAAYVYLNYGVHWMANILVKGEVLGFVLIRALEPIHGLDKMRERRQQQRVTDLCSGPGKLTKALGITGDLHGASYHRRSDRMKLYRGKMGAVDVAGDVRIGISRAQDYPWRFLIANNPHVSRKLISH